MYVIKVIKQEEEKYILVRGDHWSEAVDDINKATEYESEEAANEVAFMQLSLDNIYSRVEILKK